jgi:hypothetical protein
MDIALHERQNFYRAGALGLRALQDRGVGTQRFSTDAETRWKALRGEQADSERLGLLPRDAAVLHPLAFSARPEREQIAAGAGFGLLEHLRSDVHVFCAATPSRQGRGVVEGAAGRFRLAGGPEIEEPGVELAMLVGVAADQHRRRASPRCVRSGMRWRRRAVIVPFPGLPAPGIPGHPNAALAAEG